MKETGDWKEKKQLKKKRKHASCHMYRKFLPEMTPNLTTLIVNFKEKTWKISEG